MTVHDPALVERAARAMFMARYVVGDQRINAGLWERTSEMMREECRTDVRAALDAITEDREIVELLDGDALSEAQDAAAELDARPNVESHASGT